MNNIMLVGRLVNDVKVEITETGKKFADIVLAITRSFKNDEGIYETDFIDCRLYGNIAEQTSNYCKKGDLIGIKGRLETYNTTTDNDVKQKHMIVIGDRVTFLSSIKASVEESEEDL